MNKKIKNATSKIYNGIQFKSELEAKAYETLKNEGFNPEYEAHTYEVWKGRKFKVPCYDWHNNRKLHRNMWELNKYKACGIRYTPDFTFEHNGVFIVLETKGFANERYAYVKKLFRQWLDEHLPNSIFFEVHNKKQIKEAVEIIKNIRQSNA